MNQAISPTRSSTRITGIIFLLGALVLSIWLAVPALRHQSIVGCGVSCSEVLSSKWSTAMHIPVSVFGGLLYIATLSAVAFRKRSLSRLFITGIFGAAIYFAILQAFIIHAFCPWCCATHFLACVGGFFALRSFSHEKSNVIPWSHTLTWATLAIAAFYGIQRFGPEKTGSITVIEKQSANITLNPAGDFVVYGKHVIPQTAYPVLSKAGILPATENGHFTRSSSAAPILFLHDWTCSHCRQLHHDLAAQPSNSEIQILLLPASRESEGKAIHQLMTTAWVVNRPLYEKTATALLDGTLATTQEAVSKALGTLQATPEQAAQVANLLTLADTILTENDNRLTVSTLPQLLSVHELLTGSPSATALSAFLKNAGAPATQAATLTLATNDDTQKALYRALFIARDADPNTFAALTNTLSAGTLPTVEEVQAKLLTSLNAERLHTIEKNLGHTADALVASLTPEQLHSQDAKLVLSTLQALRVPTRVALLPDQNHGPLAHAAAPTSPSASSGAYHPTPAPVPPSASALAWENTTLPKSKVVSGQLLKQTAHFTNNLTTSVTVSSIRPSCGCTVASGANQTVAPGEKGEITIQINTAGQPIGDLAKGVTVITTEDGKPCSTLISIPYTITPVSSPEQASTPPPTPTAAHESGDHT